MKLQTSGLTPLQVAIVMAVFIFTLIGALAMTMAFRLWNRRTR